VNLDANNALHGHDRAYELLCIEIFICMMGLAQHDKHCFHYDSDSPHLPRHRYYNSYDTASEYDYHHQ
jgi:hypothetical protein